jgi:putative CRISPR-associated protein (TIGR02619 family)
MAPHPILICTVGTSLFRPNLEGLKGQSDKGTLPPQHRRLAEAYARADWSAVAKELLSLPANDRLCGAEINSIASMIEKGYVQPHCGLYFLHSQTEQGRQIAGILRQYYHHSGHRPVETVEVADLQDEDPKRFRSKGLRHLAREVAAVVRRHGAVACAINATGGYKAQIAIAVVLGQALGVTVYYKHELFSEVIAFPPMPVALDLELWMRASGMLEELASTADHPPKAASYEEEWDERYESLVERVQIDGEQYLELSPTGQIFHETLKDRFDTVRDLMPPPAQDKRPPRVEDAGWPGKHPEVKRFMQRVTDEVPFVVHCGTIYYNPDLPERTRFRLSGGEIIGQFSEGGYCVRFRVETTAQTAGQLRAAVAALNRWLHDPNCFRTPEQITVAQVAKERDDALAAWKKTEKQLADVLKQNQQLREENQQLRQQSQQLQAQVAQATQQCEALNRRLGDLQAELDAQRAAAEQQRRTADDLVEQLRACKRELAEASKPWWRRLLRW